MMTKILKSLSGRASIPMSEINRILAEKGIDIDDIVSISHYNNDPSKGFTIWYKEDVLTPDNKKRHDLNREIMQFN